MSVTYLPGIALEDHFWQENAEIEIPLQNLKGPCHSKPITT